MEVFSLICKCILSKYIKIKAVITNFGWVLAIAIYIYQISYKIKTTVPLTFKWTYIYTIKNFLFFIIHECKEEMKGNAKNICDAKFSWTNTCIFCCKRLKWYFLSLFVQMNCILNEVIIWVSLFWKILNFCKDIQGHISENLILATG